MNSLTRSNNNRLMCMNWTRLKRGCIFHHHIKKTNAIIMGLCLPVCLFACLLACSLNFFVAYISIYNYSLVSWRVSYAQFEKIISEAVVQYFFFQFLNFPKTYSVQEILYENSLLILLTFNRQNCFPRRHFNPLCSACRCGCIASPSLSFLLLLQHKAHLGQ